MYKAVLGLHFTRQQQKNKDSLLSSNRTMNDYAYSLSTKKTWRETYIELSDTMDKWGVVSWKVTEPKGARKEASFQSDEERTVTLTYVLRGRTIHLTMGKQERATDNLRVL